MHITMRNRITGFYLRPKFEILQGKEVLTSLDVELLEDGSVISTEHFENLGEEQLEILQGQLLDTTIINLNVEENWTESKRTSKKNKVLGIVNMFKMETIKKNDDNSQDIRVTFLKNGYFFTESTFKSVPAEKLEMIRNILIDNTTYNLGCDKQCMAVTSIDLIAIISLIV